MSESIISTIGNSLNSQATPGVTTWDSIRQGGTGDGGLPVPPANHNGPYVQHWTSIHEVSPEKTAFTPNKELSGMRIVGFSRLRNLLQPKHPYFDGKHAEIKHFAHYHEQKHDVDMLYPRVKTYHRENPYRKYQLNRQSSARSAKKIFKLIEQRELKGVRMIDLTTTMPKAVSEYLSRDPQAGRKSAWNMNKRLWDLMIDYCLIGEGHARRSNLHTWSSEEPLQPHYHFHEAIPNIEHVKDIQSEITSFPEHPCSECGDHLWVKLPDGNYQCATCYPVPSIPVLEVRLWKRNRKGTYVPWTEQELVRVKALWLSVVIDFVRQKGIKNAWDNQQKLLRFQRRHGIPGLCRLISWYSRQGKGLIDIMVAFDKLSTEIGKAKFMHKLAYNGRHPIEDYANYSNKHPECDDPPEFIQGYDNRARVCGWWKTISQFVDLSKKDDKEKLSPYNAETMEYMGKTYISDMLQDSELSLVAVDMIRGRPVEYGVSGDDVQWLSAVEYNEYPLIT